MSKYSETIGSFLRTGNYPLEADYIFNSELELKDFYADSKILHEGLLKVVRTENSQSLYWVYNDLGNLEFRKLIDFNSISELQLKLHELSLNITKETIYRSESDQALSIKIDKLKVDLLEIQNRLNDLLEGYDDKSLKEIIKEVVGTPNKLKTLEDLETALITFTQLTKNREDNLLSELDLTQIGVGLSGDGSYNADKETYYLKDATSIMNALKTLDRVVHKINYLFKNTDSVNLNANVDEDSHTTTISANVKIAEDSDIIIEQDGLYHRVEQEFENGILTLKVNGEVRSEHNIGLDALVEDSYYDTTIEKLVILFKLHNNEVQRVEIPVENLIKEWDFENDDPAITLNRERVIDGADKVTAEINISKEPYNILHKLGDGLDVNISNTILPFQQHLDNTNNPHNVTKEQVGLGNIDNTSDLDKPISNATLEAINEIKDDLYEKEMDTGNAVLVNKITLEKISVKPDDLEKYSPDEWEPIGVIVIPTSHDVYGTGECGVVALMSASLTTPDEGQTSNVSIYWGSRYKNISELITYNKVVILELDLNSIKEESSKGYLPVLGNYSHLEIDCPHDPITKYAIDVDNKYIASPYLINGLRNPNYYTIDLSIKNALSDFNGKINTKLLCSKVTSQINWKTDSLIINNADDGYYPAACCCWRYHTIGTNQGDWYLPACGELGYIPPRFNEINKTITILRTYFNKNFTLLNDIYWTSSLYELRVPRYVHFSNGYVGSTNSYYNENVRPFIRLKLYSNSSNFYNKKEIDEIVENNKPLFKSIQAPLKIEDDLLKLDSGLNTSIKLIDELGGSREGVGLIEIVNIDDTIAVDAELNTFTGLSRIENDDNLVTAYGLISELSIIKLDSIETFDANIEISSLHNFSKISYINGVKKGILGYSNETKLWHHRGIPTYYGVRNDILGMVIPHSNKLYEINGELYKWNGEELVKCMINKEEVKDLLKASITVEESTLKINI